ncbi:tripartite tricarboxylate transporter TctB family protein [Bacillus carboniphilus]|uniref:Tripartite tricarboxylate transporter TctB family protein n=1 Tax=Bacillus carboniphilus TaxID=86663 RepID=A0ABN0W617_9BACI
MTKSGQNIMIAGIFMLLALFIFIDSLNFPEATSKGMPGASAFPQMIAGVMFLISLILLIQSMVKKQKEKSDFLKDLDFTKTLLFIVSLTLYISLLNPIGFLISSFVFITFLMVLMQGWSKKILYKSSAISLAIVFFVYFAFAEFFKIALPIGILGF